ncbi:MAG: hypothetical protein Q4G60_03205 [bacterium]|nr:hypothetical protein [bacterium]
MERIKLVDGQEYDIKSLNATDTVLSFSVHDVDLGVLVAKMNTDNVRKIEVMSVDQTGLAESESLLMAYAGFTKLDTVSTRYNVVTDTDYTTEDDTTVSGFAEEAHNITTVTLSKPTVIEKTVTKIQEDQETQDAAIEELANLVAGEV